MRLSSYLTAVEEAATKLHFREEHFVSQELPAIKIAAAVGLSSWWYRARMTA